MLSLPPLTLSTVPHLPLQFHSPNMVFCLVQLREEKGVREKEEDKLSRIVAIVIVPRVQTLGRALISHEDIVVVVGGCCLSHGGYRLSPFMRRFVCPKP